MSPIKIKYVSRKISKVRWQPKSSSVFVTGSYNDNENKICLWKFPDVSYMNEDGENYIDDDPLLCASFPFKGCVTDLNVVSDDLIISSSSYGSIFMLRYSDKDLTVVHSWNNLHRHKSSSASVTGLSVKGPDVVSVGEDGRLCVLNFNAKQKIREIESTDLCSFTSVVYIRHQEVVAGNSLGFLRLWDLRTQSDASSCLLSLSREQAGVSCMNTHPTQSHILVSGYEDGSICVWDMRQDRKPVSLLEGHAATVSEILFHPSNPDYLYTCSADGSVWQWDSSNLRKPSPSFSAPLDSQDQNFSKGNPWLNCDAYKHKLEVTALCSQSWTCVNSLDHSGSTLIWGKDSEELCILNDLVA